MNSAFLFPGQGADIALEAKELAEEVPSVGNLLDKALEGLGMARARLWARGGRALEDTMVLQPVLTAVTLGISQTLMESGVTPRWVAGHSLGEISAWAAAGGITPAKAVALATMRGRLMGEAAKKRKGGMLAIRVRSQEAMEEAIVLGRTRGMLELAAFNAPDERVLSGEPEALDAVAATFPTTRLPVSGAWHGSMMAEAAQQLGVGVQSIQPSPLGVSFLSNRTGGVVDESRNIPRLLVEALTNPVRWAETMGTLREEGVSDIVTIGPGKALRGLARKNGLGHCRIQSTDRPVNLWRTLEILGS